MRLEGQLIKLKVRSKRFNAIHIVFGEKKPSDEAEQLQ